MTDLIYAYPTDTVWGIGGNIHSEQICQSVHRIKKSDPNKPLSVMFPNAEVLLKYLDVKKLTKHIDRFIELYEFEATILCHQSNFIKEIPKWITVGSPFVGVRVNCVVDLSEIFDTVTDPIITTSLNYTGSPPIVNRDDALRFCAENPELTFVDNNDFRPSGLSSTIFKLDESSELTLIREGHHVSKLEALIQDL